MWETLIQPYGWELEVIDNTAEKTDAEKERDKLINSSALLITGGNTYTLLHNLKQSGLDQEIIKFTKRTNFTLAGFSAGAAVLTPNINVIKYRNIDTNSVNLQDLAGLGIVDFEIYPHFKDENKNDLNEYQKTTQNEVFAIKDDEFMVIDFKI